MPRDMGNGRGTSAEKARNEFLHAIGVCIVTGRETDIHVAHIRYADSYFGKEITGMRKPHWIWTLPVSGELHVPLQPGRTAQHEMGEKAFWGAHGFNPDDVRLSPLHAALALGGYQLADDIEGARAFVKMRARA